MEHQHLERLGDEFQRFVARVTRLTFEQYVSLDPEAQETILTFARLKVRRWRQCPVSVLPGLLIHLN